jgi:hypothetical protein
VRTGAVSATELRLIADAQELPLMRVANAVSDAANLPYFMGQVVLRRAASVEPRPDEKARLLAQALTLGEKAGLLPLTAALQGDVIATLKPTAQNKIYARRFAQSLVLAKRYQAASLWAAGDPVMSVIIAMAAQDATRLAAAQRELAGFALSLSKNPPDPDSDRSYKALVLGLADVLGMTMPPEAKVVAAAVPSQRWEGKHPRSQDMRALEEAASTPERRGEAVLALTSLIKAQGLADMAPDATMAFVRLLTNINENQSARALALEALAQYDSPRAGVTPP